MFSSLKSILCLESPLFPKYVLLGDLASLPFRNGYPPSKTGVFLVIGQAKPVLVKEIGWSDQVDCHISLPCGLYCGFDF